jgi:hypothetical protein
MTLTCRQFSCAGFPCFAPSALRRTEYEIVGTIPFRIEITHFCFIGLVPERFSRPAKIQRIPDTFRGVIYWKWLIGLRSLGSHSE